MILFDDNPYFMYRESFQTECVRNQRIKQTEGKSNILTDVLILGCNLQSGVFVTSDSSLDDDFFNSKYLGVNVNGKRN